MFEWFKFVEICIVYIIGFINDEQFFNTFVLMKNKVHNWLNTHLDLWVNMFSQTFFILKNFPYDEAIIVWKKKKTCKAIKA